MVWLTALRERLRESLWLLPAVFAIGAAVLALVLVAIDDRVAREPDRLFFAFGGTPEGARSVLSTIAQSMLTFTGLVFTITMLVLQLASSQLSPRVMRTFLRDRGNQVVLGVFVATFVYTLLVLREVRTPIEGSDGFVPAISVWVAFALLLASVASFIYYIDHMAHAIRASTVIANIWAETVAAIERQHPDIVRSAGDDEPFGQDAAGGARTDPEPPGVLLKAGSAGVLIGVSDERLLRAAGRASGRIELIPRVGDFVPEDAPLARLFGDWDRASADEVRESIALGGERTLEQDVAFGLRQLVDVAVRALSPATNDPTTAVQVLDRIHDLLRRLALRRVRSPDRTDADGIVRLVVPATGWDDYVRLGFEEIRLAGQSQIQVVRRMRRILNDLMSIAPDDRLGVIRDELARLDEAVVGSFGPQRQRAAALVDG